MTGYCITFFSVAWKITWVGPSNDVQQNPVFDQV